MDETLDNSALIDQAVADLVDALDDPDHGVRIAVAKALGTLRRPSTIGPLIANLRSGQGRHYLAIAIRDILDTVDDQTHAGFAPALADALVDRTTLTDEHRAPRPWDPANAQACCDTGNRRHREQQVRDKTAELLALAGQPALAPLSDALGHEFDIIRHAAAVGLGILGNVEAIPVLMAATLDIPYVNSAVIEALGKLGAAAIPKLTALLADPDDHIRGEAAKALGAIGDEMAVPALVAALDDPDIFVRREAVDAIGAIKPASTPPELIELLSKERWTDDLTWFKYPWKPGRHHTAAALGKIGDAAAVDALIDALQDSDVYDAVCNALEEAADRRAVPALIGHLKDQETHARRCAWMALRKFGHPDVIPALAGCIDDFPYDTDCTYSPAEALADVGDKAFPALLDALRNGSPTARWTAAHAIARRSPTATFPGALDALAAALDDEHDLVRKWAAIGLRNYGNSDHVPALVAALGRTDRKWRTEVAHTLGKIGDPSALPALVTALDDPSEIIRHWAARMIGWLKLTDIPQPLFTALVDADDAELRRDAAMALGELGNPAVIPALIEAIADVDADVRRRAVDALGDLRDPAALPALMSVIRSVSPRPADDEIDQPCPNNANVVEIYRFSAVYAAALGYEAANAIGKIGGPAAVEAAVELATSPDERLRYWSVVALRGIGDVNTIPNLLTILKDTDHEVRKAAAGAIEKILVRPTPHSE